MERGTLLVPEGVTGAGGGSRCLRVLLPPQSCLCLLQNLWICLICGHIGCGRYVSRHAYKHFEETQHTYAMQLTNHRVWDYAGGEPALTFGHPWEHWLRHSLLEVEELVSVLIPGFGEQPSPLYQRLSSGWSSWRRENMTLS